MRNDLASAADFGNTGNFRLSYCLIRINFFSITYGSWSLNALLDLELECLEAGEPLGGDGGPPPPLPPLREDNDDDDPGGDGGALLGEPWIDGFLEPC